MHNFSMLLTQKCLSMGLIDKSYSEWLSYSIEKRATTLLTWFVLCLVGFFGFGWKLTLSIDVFPFDKIEDDQTFVRRDPKTVDRISTIYGSDDRVSDIQIAVQFVVTLKKTFQKVTGCRLLGCAGNDCNQKSHSFSMLSSLSYIL